jgi:hypothetical protein
MHFLTGFFFSGSHPYTHAIYSVLFGVFPAVAAARDGVFWGCHGTLGHAAPPAELTNSLF